MEVLQKTLYASHLSDILSTDNAISKSQAENLFTFFKNCKTFRWADANNNCEGRANAMCILLDEWRIPNGKAWAFSGYVFNKIGFLQNIWKYHVATLVPVLEENEINFYVIDPSTSDRLLILAEWAANITSNPHSYHFMKKGDYYIFHPSVIKKDNWFKRNKRNYNWTIQSLAGINGKSSKGKAQLSFNKKRVRSTALQFMELLKLGPLI